VRLGFFLIVHIKNHQWDNPAGGTSLSFVDVIERLNIRAIELTKANPDIDRIEVVSIDFREPQL